MGVGLGLRFKDLPQLHEAVALQIHYYNTERIHSALCMSQANLKKTQCCK
jgi:hypothetical protein